MIRSHVFFWKTLFENIQYFQSFSLKIIEKDRINVGIYILNQFPISFKSETISVAENLKKNIVKTEKNILSKKTSKNL